MIRKITRPVHWSGVGIFTLVIGFTLTVSNHTSAALIENMTIANPKATALGNAVTADPPGIDSIHYNPAGLARVKGREGLFKLALVSFTFGAEFGDYDPVAQTEIDKWGLDETDSVVNSASETSTPIIKVPFVDGRTEWPLPVVIVPTGGAAYRPSGKNYTVGTAAFVPFAAGYVREEEDDPARFMGTELAMTRLTYFSPTIGFQFNDEWSFGVGIHFSYNGLSAQTDLRLALLPLGVINTALEQIGEGSDCLGGAFELCGHSLSPFEEAIELDVDVETALSVSAVFGALWQPTSWFTWGFVYQTEADNKMKGSYRLTYSDDWQALWGSFHNELAPIPAYLGFPKGVAEQTGEATVDLKHPAHFSTGVSVQVTPRWKINLDAKWTDWDVWEGFRVEFDAPFELGSLAGKIVPHYASTTSLVIPRNYESVWNVAMGVEYQYNDRLVLRAGWEPRKSSVPDDKLDVLLPMGEADLYGVGLGYEFLKNMHVELALAYFISKNDIPAGSSTNANDLNPATSAWYNPYTGIDIKTETSAIMFESSFTWQF
ncbi:aromatic hydrocarbon degradation protein [Ketobacter sp. MCCC 1A13808]|uniref:OmpP1/FadL family transporter n=1 Tax=Ketobacter sp. MCCC 1A13808 TaxID=2602738 RepID=UPI0012EB57AF|nr:outer membrane protein transport protein [Ketobacter sp. MCCC 1A13808]MVF14894.1 aromatic hydrocarbon degradation protein [Ketobacter sp. MCCC 1A13808]